MPTSQLRVDAELVRGLLQAQQPQLADQPLVEVGEGWANHLFRLGSEFAVRLPRREEAAALMAKEQQWLPMLTAGLPTATSVPVYCGAPQEPYPYPWSISAWYDGLDVSLQPRGRNLGLAAPLAEFLNAFHTPAPPDYPRNPVVGGPLASRDAAVQERLHAGMVPRAARVGELWAEALAVPGWNSDPVWLHGDLHPANLIAGNGTLQAVIDFGDLTAGDPAADLAAAWLVFEPAGRRAFRSALGARYDADPYLWLRARGWALCMASNLLAGAQRHPGLYLVGSETLMEILTDDLSWL
ncbi:aminoglycoside phosphotransferase family protein [Arthrobacter caoxuetaonis]|uniref:Aminoglycoside phosphotransferase family protein n=1 Tax=Arthrobacter caoxuetaonis TaxID=2886935 RepID=A0A9X1SBE4_9MICC|nr:aminoglycoside phosphotransferase family protein [Arthrobacter caoxuetaonis]MCC3297148.1 aminoglycoside phosphotransferase family protein [Arthrobacter caoxuetaonis]USQ58292.1 aminoglycoside phosphotransferase family protein [Arthrobacter caoxuetaonis]